VWARCNAACFKDGSWTGLARVARLPEDGRTLVGDDFTVSGGESLATSEACLWPEHVLGSGGVDWDAKARLGATLAVAALAVPLALVWTDTCATTMYLTLAEAKGAVGPLSDVDEQPGTVMPPACT
jgi:hypothetical protein